MKRTRVSVLLPVGHAGTTLAAMLAEARATEVTARRTQQLATLRAPIAGVVTRLDAVLGQLVDASRPIVVVADPAAVETLLSLSPAQAARVHAGDTVTVAACGVAGVESLGEAVVTTVAATVDAATRSVAWRARITRVHRTVPKVEQGALGVHLTMLLRLVHF